MESQYSVTPDPLVQLNVTVEAAKIEPGAGEKICAVPLLVGVLVRVGVGVAGATVLVGVSDGPTVGLVVAVPVEVAVLVAVGVLVGPVVPVPGP